jgi:hypothetical protein
MNLVIVWLSLNSRNSVWIKWTRQSLPVLRGEDNTSTLYMARLFHSCVRVVFFLMQLCFFFSNTLLILYLVQTGDKSSEATARMNLSDLKLLLVLGQNPSSSLNTNSSSNLNSNSSVRTENLRKQNTLPGTSPYRPTSNNATVLLLWYIYIYWLIWV